MINASDCPWGCLCYGIVHAIGIVQITLSLGQIVANPVRHLRMSRLTSHWSHIINALMMRWITMISKCRTIIWDRCDCPCYSIVHMIPYYWFGILMIWNTRPSSTLFLILYMCIGIHMRFTGDVADIDQSRPFDWDYVRHLTTSSPHEFPNRGHVRHFTAKPHNPPPIWSLRYDNIIDYCIWYIEIYIKCLHIHMRSLSLVIK
jgi:hypothetical protein